MGRGRMDRNLDLSRRTLMFHPLMFQSFTQPRFLITPQLLTRTYAPPFRRGISPL